MEIDTSYGYPLLRHKDETGNTWWYYPQVPDEWTARVGMVPKLLQGVPTIHVQDGWRVTIFTVTSEAWVPPIVMSVRQV